MGAYMHIVQKNRKEIHNAETEKYVKLPPQRTSAETENSPGGS
jgi:hypothetical protein